MSQSTTKMTKWAVHPAKTLIRPGICAGWWGTGHFVGFVMLWLKLKRDSSMIVLQLLKIFLISAYSGADESQRLSQLKLALTWNRVDIAQEEIFREDVHWKQGTVKKDKWAALWQNKQNGMCAHQRLGSAWAVGFVVRRLKYLDTQKLL